MLRANAFTRTEVRMNTMRVTSLYVRGV